MRGTTSIMPLTSRIAAMHGALWRIDRGYRFWWYIWPASIALLILGWIYVEKPRVATTSSSVRWAKPATPASRADSGVNWPEKLRGDVTICFNSIIEFNPGIEACSRLLDSGLLPDVLSARVYAQRGSYFLTTQPDRALVDLDAALKLRPDTPEPRTDRGWIYLNRGRFEAALEDLNKAIELFDPALAGRARLYRGYTFFKLHDNLQATSDLNEAQKINPKNPDPYLWRGDVEFAEQAYDAALRDFDEYSKRVPRDARGLIGRGMVLEATGHPREALLAYERALKLDPSNSRALADSKRLRSTQSTGDP
jgi:Tfp pilus assembly protein PilF